MEKINKIINSQKDFFLNKNTLNVNVRLEKLKLLKKTIKQFEPQIFEALKKDLNKSAEEAYMSEVGIVLEEITYVTKKVKGWAKPKRVKTPWAQFHSKSYKLAHPYGNTLIIAPFNYPFMLALAPLVDCIAAGNTAIIKPSEYTPNTSKVVKKIINTVFEPSYVEVVLGAEEEVKYLLEQRFNYIFFTGSTRVGKIVYQKASKYLTPVTLELGGKSPCIVDNTANIKLAAKRIIFGKLLNCGQTCVAPDYVYCHKDVKEQLIAELKNQIVKQIGADAFANLNYGKIVNEQHLNRQAKLINKNKVVYGGNVKGLQIEPTILNNVEWDDLVMQEEVFGPILPIVEFDDLNSAINKLKTLEHPLALYVFSTNKQNINAVTTSLNFGGGCVNDVIIHLATTQMGFGGVGNSGMGSYHGKVGFDSFSHYKSIVDKKNWIDLPMRYQPFNKFKDKLVRMFLR